MKKITILNTILVILVIAIGGGIFLNWRYDLLKGFTTKSKSNDIYYCPMHPDYTSDKPGTCPKCGMSLVKRQANQPAEANEPVANTGTSKILYYRNPMNPNITSPVPMKDEMGMDYVPVYAKSQSQQENTGVYISPQKQQLIGVKTAKIEKQILAGQIETVGMVAYDPDLFVAQEEYLSAIKTYGRILDSNLVYAKEQNDKFLTTARRKLMLLGMSEDEIADLTAAGVPDENLYLPEGDKVWIYLYVYQYESEFVKADLPIEVETNAYPGEIFKGDIISVSPILDASTITFKVRALVENPEKKLKLQTFVNARIKYDLGEKLAVPQEAIMDSGLRKYAFIAKPDGYFEPRDVKLGAKAGNLYEVLGGLKEGDIVTVSANFLIDSESKLNAVITRMGEPNQPAQQ